MIFSPKLKSLFKRFIVVCVSLVVIVFVLNVLADNPYSHRLVREIINDKVKSETNVNLDFQAIKVSIIPFGVDLYGLSVSPHNQEEVSLFKASQIKARVSLWSIIIGKPKLGILEFYDPEITYPLPAGFDLLPHDRTSGADQAPVRWPLPFDSLPVDTVSFKNARLYIELPDDEDPNTPLLVSSITGLDLSANVSDLSEIELYLLAKDIDLEITGKPILKGTEFETDVILSEEQLHKSPFRILSENLDFGGIISGKFERSRGNILQALNLNVEFEGKGDIAQLGMIFDIPDTGGIISGQGQADIGIPVEKEAEPTLLVTAKANSTDAKIRDFRLYQTSAEIEVDLDKLTINEANVRVGEKSYGKASGTIGFDPSIPINFKATPDGLPLTDLLAALTVEFDTLESKITSNNLVVQGVGDPLQLNVSAVADFDNLHLPKIRAIPASNTLFPTCRMAVNLQVNEERIIFDNSQGSCFIHAPASEKSIVPDSAPTPPLDAQHVAPIAFSGFATFNEVSGMDLRVRSSELPLPLLNEIANIPLHGEGTVEANIRGPYSGIIVGTDFRLSDLAVFDIPFGRATGVVQLTESGNVLTWRDIRSIFPNNGSLFSPQGRINLESFQTELELTVQDAPAEMLEKMFVTAGVPGMSLKVHSLSADLRGPLLQPMAFRGEADFFLKEFVIQDRGQFDIISGNVSLGEEVIQTKDLKVEFKDFQLRNEIQITRANKIPPRRDEESFWKTIGLDPNAAVKIKSETFVSQKWREARTSPSFFIDHLQSLPLLKEYASAAHLQGRLALSLDLQGSLNELEGSFHARTEKTSLLGSAIAPLTVNGILGNRKLDLIASHSGNALEGRISVDLNQETLPYQWYFKANRLDLRALGSQFFAKDPRNFAYLTGAWKMEGELTDWWHSEGELAINDVRVRYYRDVRGESKVLELKDERPVTIEFHRNGWSFRDNKELLLDSDRFRLHVGLGNTRPPEKFNVTFDGYFDLVLLQNMSQVIETASGLVQFEGEVTGSVDDPDFSFNIRNKKDATDAPVAIGFAPIRPPFTDVNFDATYADDKLTINSLTAKKGSGRVTMSGQTVLAETSVEDSRIDITFDHATVFYQVAVLKSFEMELSGAVSISGNRPPFDISGDIVVNRARSTREFDLREQIIGALQRRELDTPLVPDDPIANLDLRISADNSIEIYNRTIQSVLSANLVIKGTNVIPIVNGQVEVNKGSFAYKYRRDFRITQGLITFDDPVRPDPRLDILGVSEISGYRVYLAITGRASNPKVDLSVDPPSREDGTPLTKLDILVLMSTGSLPERTQSNSATSAAQAEALNILVGQFEEPVEKLFDLSGQTVVQRVYIDTYAGEDGPTPRLNLPLNLHRDWDVIFRVDENNQKVSLGYTINESISVSGSVDSQRENPNTRVNRSEATQNGPDTGVDLKFRFAFP